MDPLLPAPKTRCAFNRVLSRPEPKPITARIQNRSASFYCVVVCFVAVILSGCQANKLGKTKIPVPPPVLDVDSLDNVRLQSPDGPSVRNTVRSLQVAPVVEASDSAKKDRSQIVADVVVNGNKMIPTHQLMSSIRTRPGRYFDPDILQQDVDQLWRMPEINRINGPYLENTANGIIVTLDIVERNVISEVKFVGNRGITDRALAKELNLNDGDPLDIHEIRMAKTRIEEMYKEKGYPRTQVEILEGNETG